MIADTGAAAAGAKAGSAFGPLGSIAGALAGKALGGLFRKKPGCVPGSRPGGLRHQSVSQFHYQNQPLYRAAVDRERAAFIKFNGRDWNNCDLGVEQQITGRYRQYQRMDPATLARIHPGIPALAARVPAALPAAAAPGQITMQQLIAALTVALRR